MSPATNPTDESVSGLCFASHEPFNAERQAQIDNAEYQFGFQAAMRGELNTASQTLAWHRGWADVQEFMSTAALTPAYRLHIAGNN
jgi:hypothetical protein